MFDNLSVFKPLYDIGYREYSFIYPIYILTDNSDFHINFNFSELTVDKYWCDCSVPFTFDELLICYNILKFYKE